MPVFIYLSEWIVIRYIIGQSDKESEMKDKKKDKFSESEDRSASDRLLGIFKQNENKPTALENYRAAMDPIKRRHLARKAGMSGYAEDSKGRFPEEVKKIKTDILHQLADLKEEIDDLSDSCLSFCYGSKIRVKRVKCRALEAVLNAKTMEDMRRIAEKEQGNSDVIAGIRSRTARLLERIINVDPENKTRLRR
jgi:hypothetical protein